MQITNISNFNIAQSVKVTVDTMSFTVIVTVKYTAFLLILHSETMFSCYYYWWIQRFHSKYYGWIPMFARFI